MSRLDVAVQRFNDALSALEAQVAPFKGIAGEAADAQAKIAELHAEREGLLSRIAQLEEENRALAATNEEIDGRLDGAIGEIRSALGR